MRRLIAAICLAATCLAAIATAARAEAPALRIAVLKFGTVNWLTETLVAEGLDRAHGFRLDVVPLAGKAATTIAFEAGDVDLIVSDWPWALRRRAQGLDLRFAPYSTALGALITRGDVADLCDLRGRGVGVVGGELDKSWLVLQALAARRCGFDLARETQALFGAPPLMSQQLESGAVDAVSSYWPYAARLEAAGMTRLMDIAEAMAALGIEPAPALVGFVWNAARIDRAALAGFLDAVAEAGAILAHDDAAWERLRPLMRVDNDPEFRALRDAYRAGIADAWTDRDTEAARRLHAVLTETGGAAVADEVGPFDPALFDATAAPGQDAG